MQKNILFLMTDQHRADYVSYEEAENVRTPNIDRLAEGMVFSCCQSVDPVCMPARSALLTGRYPHQIGALAMSGDLSLQHPTCMQALQKAGYYTCGIGKFHFLQTWDWQTPRGRGIPIVDIKEDMKKWGFDYIWESSGKQQVLRNYCDYSAYLDHKGILESYRDFLKQAGPNTNYADDPEEGYPVVWPWAEEDYVDVITADQIIEQIKNRPKDKPFCIFGSFCCPHKPFDAPQRYLDMVEAEEKEDFIPGDRELKEDDKQKLYQKRRSYKAMIRLVDDQIGRIYKVLQDEELWDETVILFTSDHGEMMGDHGRLQKNIYYRQACTVPTAIRHPEYLINGRCTSPVEITDLTATMLEIAGLDPLNGLSKAWPAFHDRIPCRSLMPIVRGETDEIRKFSYSEYAGEWQMVQNEKIKYVRFLQYREDEAPREILYDLQKDPSELVNVVQDPEYKEILDQCKKYREYIIDNTPAAQLCWAPLIGPEEGVL